jgi:RNase P subunit RPR2
MNNSKKLSKEEIKEKIKQTFLSQNPTQKQIKKAKKLAMSKNIKLGILKKKFCKKCFNFFTPNNSEIRIKKGFKIIKCKNCNHLNRYKLI